MAQATADPTSSVGNRTGSGVAGLVGLGIAIAVLVAAGLTALSGARPIATLSLEAQERHERRERVYRDD